LARNRQPILFMVHAFIVVDLGFGDAGKGTIVDALTRHFNAGLVVRFNGGSQAAPKASITLSVSLALARFGLEPRRC
jgi:adenylosuccinate synthase